MADPTTRDKAGRWVQGQSGNTEGKGGRTAGISALVREATNEGQDVIEFLVKMFKGKFPNASPKLRMEAGKELLDRGFGKAIQYAEVDNTIRDVRKELAEFTTEELRKLLELRTDVSST